METKAKTAEEMNAVIHKKEILNILFQKVNVYVKSACTLMCDKIATHNNSELGSFQKRMKL